MTGNTELLDDLDAASAEIATKHRVDYKTTVDAALEKIREEIPRYPRWFEPTRLFHESAGARTGLAKPPALFRHVSVDSLAEYWNGSAWQINDRAICRPTIDWSVWGVELGMLDEVGRARAAELTGGNP